MPGGDGTGPLGLGPRTGRALGFCAGYNVPGYMNIAGRGFRRFFGRGFGRGFAWRRWMFAQVIAPYRIWEPIYPPTPGYYPTKEEQIRNLESEARAIEEEQKELGREMEEIRKKIEELRSTQ